MIKNIITTQSSDRSGIVAALTSCLAANDGLTMELAQFETPQSERFYSRTEFRVPQARFEKFKIISLSDTIHWQFLLM